jgi:Zn-dependent M28 family amino/carboxypeptidase
MLRSAAFACSVFGLLGAAAPASADTGAFRHVEALEAIAVANGGNRAAGTAGYDRSAEYVARQLEGAGYRVRFEDFTFPFYEERSPPVLVIGGPEGAPPREAMRTLMYSGSGDVTGRLQAVDLGFEPGATDLPASTSGCEKEDFEGFERGRIALVRRGTCPFQAKVDNATMAGATGIIIMNEGRGNETGTFGGRLSQTALIPVLGVTTDLGRALLAQSLDAASPPVRLAIQVETGTRTTRNVLAERPDATGEVVVVGAHLDSVPEGPGMNDNASGTAAVLQNALDLAREPQGARSLRFAFWGAEERGLIGSRHYVNALSEEERKRIALYINLDMVGSPNPGRFIQFFRPGENAPEGALQKAAREALGTSLREQNAAFIERSRGRMGGTDDASFAAKNIPTVGLYTGAGEAKSPEQAAQFGGEAGKPYDACYHRACDNAGNVDRTVLGQMTRALNHALRDVLKAS